jgi:aminoglycoside phosphotransferase (APT) family kinase protein
VELGRPIAVGRTAEVFAWSDGRVLKLYRPGMPEGIGHAEARAARVVDDAGLAAPRMFETTRVEGRLGLVYERVEGRSMLETFPGRPWRVGRLAGQFAALHAAMHDASGEGLPDLKGYLARMMELAGEALPADLRSAALERLRGLPDGGAILHGDMHPGNVLMGASGPMAIDWMTVTRGDPAADVARTLFLLREGDLPGEAGVAQRAVVDLIRRWFAGSYLRAYLRLRRLDRVDVLAWYPVVLAAGWARASRRSAAGSSSRSARRWKARTSGGSPRRGGPSVTIAA